MNPFSNTMDFHYYRYLRFLRALAFQWLDRKTRVNLVIKTLLRDVPPWFSLCDGVQKMSTPLFSITPLHWTPLLYLYLYLYLYLWQAPYLTLGLQMCPKKWKCGQKTIIAQWNQIKWISTTINWDKLYSHTSGAHRLGAHTYKLCSTGQGRLQVISQQEKSEESKGSADQTIRKASLVVVGEKRDSPRLCWALPCRAPVQVWIAPY